MEPVVCAAGLNARALDGPLFEDGLLTLAGYRPGWAVLMRAADRSLSESGELVKIFDAAIDDGRDYYSACVRIAR
jgi:hypothetical protein